MHTRARRPFLSRTFLLYTLQSTVYALTNSSLFPLYRLQSTVYMLTTPYCQSVPKLKSMLHQWETHLQLHKLQSECPTVSKDGELSISDASQTIKGITSHSSTCTVQQNTSQPSYCTQRHSCSMPQSAVSFYTSVSDIKTKSVVMYFEKSDTAATTSVVKQDPAAQSPTQAMNWWSGGRYGRGLASLIWSPKSGFSCFPGMII